VALYKQSWNVQVPLFHTATLVPAQQTEP